jgi:hypothetical protein
MWVSPENYYTDQQPLRLAGRTAKSQLVQPNASHPTTDDPRLSRTKFAHFLLRRRGCPVAWSRTDPDKGTLLSKDVRFILDGPIKNGRFARCIQMYPAVIQSAAHMLILFETLRRIAVIACVHISRMPN